MRIRIGTRIAMGKPYSQDLRERVIATVDAGTRVCDLPHTPKHT
jgi:hypothetical protein